MSERVWLVIPGRRVAHSFAAARDGRLYAKCGQCNPYCLSGLLDIDVRHCEQCETVLATGISYAMDKFFHGYVRPETKRKVRAMMRRGAR